MQDYKRYRLRMEAGRHVMTEGWDGVRIHVEESEAATSHYTILEAEEIPDLILWLGKAMKELER